VSRLSNVLKEDYGSPLLEGQPPVSAENFQRESQQLQLGLSFEQTTDVNPDEHAEAMEISKEVKLPPDAIRQDLPTYREQARKQKVDYSKLLKESPRLAKILTDPDFAKVAADDIDVLESIGTTLRRTVVDPVIAIAGKAPVAFSQSLVGMADVSLGTVDKAAGTFFGLNKEYIFDPFLSAIGEEEMGDLPSMFGDYGSLGGALEETIGLKFEETQRTINQWLSPETLKSMGKVEKAEGFMDTVWEYANNPAALSQDVLTSWPHLVASMATAKKAIALGATEAEALLAAHIMEGAVTAGSLNESMQEQGVSPGDARKYSSAAGAMTSLIGLGAGKLGLGDAVESTLIPKKVSKTIFAKTAKASFKEKAKVLGVEAGKGFIQEGVIEEGLQNTSEAIFENLATGRPVFEGIGKAYAQGLATGGIMGSTMNVFSRVANDSNAIKTAQDNQDTMEALGDSAKASKLRERSSEQFQKFVDETTKDGPVENVYISAEKFDEYFQTQGIDPDQVMSELPEIQEQLAQARERNGDIVIPLNLYAGKIAGTEHHAGLIQDIKFNPTELTPREAAQLKESLPSIMEDYIKMEQEALDREVVDQDSYDRILEAATNMQVEAGELRTQSAKRADLLARTFTTLGERYNLDPVKMFESFGLEVRGPAQQEIAKADNLDKFINKARKGRIPKQREIYGKSVLEMLADRGGVIDEGGELSARDADKWHIKRYNRKFVKEGGLSLDGAREAAIEEGYLNEGDDVNELMDVIDKELRGENVYATQNINQEKADQLQETEYLIDYLSQKGIDLATATNEEVKMALEGGEQAIDNVIEYNQYKDFKVEIEAVEEETGRTISISENADIALQEVDDAIQKLQELIKCVGA